MRPGLLATAAALAFLFAHAGGGAGAVGDAALPGQFGVAHAQPDQLPFITTWKTDAANQTITIPLVGSGMAISWGDGAVSIGVSGIATHAYANPGTYEVSVYGGLEAISLDGHPDAARLVSIDQWGDVPWRTMGSAFSGAANMAYAATDAPDLSRVTDMSQMFRGATAFNGDISSWDTSSVTNMTHMFSVATAFNQPLNNWDVSSVTDMHGMFFAATSFNQPLNNWDVSSVTDMYAMFYGTPFFNRPLNNWDVSSVTSMSNMFHGAISFNQPLDSWDVSSVTDMGAMLQSAASFNQPLDSWDVSSVTDMTRMFSHARSFNQPIGGWDVSSVTDMTSMFLRAGSFNQPLNTWDVSSVTNMTRMLDFAASFDRNLGGWYVAIDNASIDRADVPGMVGTISTQNAFLDGQNPTYLIEPGGDSDRFEITGGNILRMVSADADRTVYTVTIYATGDSVFEDGNNRRTVQVTLVG